MDKTKRPKIKIWKLETYRGYLARFRGTKEGLLGVILSRLTYKRWVSTAQVRDEGTGFRGGGGDQQVEESRGDTMKCICVLEGRRVDTWVTDSSRDQLLVHWPCVALWNLSSVLRRIHYFEGNRQLFKNRFVFERSHGYPAGNDGVILGIDTERSDRVLREAYTGHFREERHHALRFGYVWISIWQRAEQKLYIIGGTDLDISEYPFDRERNRSHMLLGERGGCLASGNSI